MTNALVFIEACTVCGRVQRTYLGRRSRRKTPLMCASCARPWIQWQCSECAAENQEQVEALPKRGAHSGVCSTCGVETEGAAWTRCLREDAATTKAPRLGRMARNR